MGRANEDAYRHVAPAAYWPRTSIFTNTSTAKSGSVSIDRRHRRLARGEGRAGTGEG